MQKYEQPKKSPNSINHGAIRGLLYFHSKLNRDLRAILQGKHQAVIAHDGNFINHGVSELFVKLDGRRFKLAELKEETAELVRLSLISPVF